MFDAPNKSKYAFILDEKEERERDKFIERYLTADPGAAAKPVKEEPKAMKDSPIVGYYCQ